MSSREFGRAFLRVAGRRTGENRWIKAFYKAGSVTLKSVTRVVHVLWLEVTGLLFLVLAVVGAGAAIRQYHRYSSGRRFTWENFAGRRVRAAVRILRGELVLEVEEEIVSVSQFGVFQLRLASVTIQSRRDEIICSPARQCRGKSEFVN